MLLYAPWIPVAFRQATNPPVPPWRTAPDLWHALRESWTALSLGQSAPGWLWPALLLTLGLYGLGLVALRQISESANRRIDASATQIAFANRRSLHSLILPIATLGPLALILLVSLVTPLYHVRYLFTYSPPFYVVMAAGLAWLLRRSKVVFAVALGVWLAAAGVTLHAYWHDPAYRADDHRAAVRYVREHWRPGDVVLVNAGWPYTALTTYWDGPIATRSRLTGDLPATPDDPNALVMVTTGHVDGDPGLGWGDPRSDFFAMPADAAREQIAALFGPVRARLAIPHLRHRERPGGPGARLAGGGWATFRRSGVCRRGEPARAGLRAPAGCGSGGRVGRPPRSGRTCPCAWDRSPARSPAARRSTRRWTGSSPAQPVDFATSIRLIGPDGAIWAQPPDERPSGPLLPASQWTEDQAYRQTLKLPVPAGTPPGQYAVELVVYDPATGQPWPAQAGDLALTPNGLRLGEVTVVRPDPSPPMQPALATFGPLALIEATSPATTSRRAGRCRSICCGRRPRRRASRSWSWCSCRTPPAASSPGWRRSRSTAAIRRRTGPPASSCATGTPSRCRPTWRRARTG